MKKNNESFLSLDDIINNIGFGKFQLKQYFVCFLIVMNYISHVVLSGYMLPAMINQWNLSLFELSFIGGLEYFMQVMGSIMVT